ncbi:MAG: hypothetical protein GX492_09850 [Firmicutes bacterium]|nr:hypothetical protein [Bacillota bacterium]
MGTCSFRDFERVCRILGLKPTRGGTVWEGTDPGGAYRRVAIHAHSKGKDIPTGTFHRMLRDIGLRDEAEFRQVLRHGLVDPPEKRQEPRSRRPPRKADRGPSSKS